MVGLSASVIDRRRLSGYDCLPVRKTDREEQVAFLFQSHRSAVFARHGVVATSQPLATMAGVRILLAGGNAADAAVAAAAALSVTEPMSTGLGGDCFALYYDADSGKVYAVNGSGRAPAGLTREIVERRGLVSEKFQFADPYHPLTITVPGAFAGWCDLIDRFGSMPLPALLAPAVELAGEGFPVAPLTALSWEKSAERLRRAGGVSLTIEGRAPRQGELFRNPDFARTLAVLAEGGRDVFYKGAVAEAIAACVQEAGGVLTVDDLAAHCSTWEEPISTTYRNLRVWECAPNGQGIAALIALNIVEGTNAARYPPLSASRLHLLIEAMRLAWADCRRYVADPAVFPVPVEGLLSKEYAAERRKLISPERATLTAEAGVPPSSSDTVYLCVVDGRGNACSFVNSIYMSFGTGIVPPGLGFALHNRGANFSLDATHPNCVAPRKRPYHTIIAGMLTREDGSLFGPFGVMGGFMQPQGHLQVAVGLVDDGCDPQEALDRPRFFLPEACPSSRVLLEEGIPKETVSELARMGHPASVVAGYDRLVFGRGQVIVREKDGTLRAGSDAHADGCAAGW